MLRFILGFSNTSLPTYSLTNQGKSYTWVFMPLKLLFCIRAEKPGEAAFLPYEHPFSFNYNLSSVAYNEGKKCFYLFISGRTIPQTK